MEKLSALRAKRGKLVDELVALSKSDTFDTDAFKAKEKEIADVNEQIKAVESAQALAAGLAVPTAGGQNPGETFERRFHSRTSKLKFFKGPNAEERAHRFGQFMLAAIWGNTKATEWCGEHGVSLQRAQGEGVNAAGGVLVPEEFSAEIIDLRDDYGMFRRLCHVVPMGRDTMNTPRRTGGLTAYPVGEGVAGTLSTAGWDNVKLTANKWMVLTLMSSELDEDAVINIGDTLVGEIAYAFAVAEDTAGFAGDGTSAYHNIKGFQKIFNDGAGSLAGSVNAASGHDTFAEIDGTDLATLMAKLPQYVYRKGNPSFYCSQVAWALVFQRLIIASGGISKDDVTGRVIYRYLGFDVEITPSMPTAISTLNAKSMIEFGDISMAAAFGDRRGMTVQRSTEYKFAEDQIALKATERFDINIHDTGDTVTPGPVVSLMGN